MAAVPTTRDVDGFLGRSRGPATIGIGPTITRNRQRGTSSSQVGIPWGRRDGYSSVDVLIPLDGSGDGLDSLTIPESAATGIAQMFLDFSSATGATMGWVTIASLHPIGVPLRSGSGVQAPAWIAVPGTYDVAVAAPGASGGSFTLSFIYPTRSL